MSLLFIDGFDAGDYLTKWNSMSVQYGTSATTRFGTGLALSTASASAAFRKDVTAASKLIIGFAVKLGTFSDSGNLILFYGDAGATNHTNVRIMANGAVALYRSTTQVAISAAGVCQLNTWHYLEVSATVNDTTGVITAKVDGVQAATFTGDTKNAGTALTLDRVDINTVSSSGGLFDDFYIADGVGAAPWNDFLGDMRVQLVKPSGAGSQTDLTPVGTANNWDNVNETPASVTDYNYSATPGARDLYAMEDLSAATTAVLGVQLVTIAHKTDSAARSVKNLVKSGATITAGTAKALAVSPSSLTTVHQVNPTTAAAWTVAEANAMETGVEVV